MKLTLIAYHFYPEPGPASQRWGQFSKYLSPNNEIRIFSDNNYKTKKIVWSFWIFVRLLFEPLGDKIIVTGPPWSSVVAVTLASIIRRKPLIVDFRDLWSTEPSLKRNSKAWRFLFRQFEKLILWRAQSIIVVNINLRNYYQHKNSFVIPNGYSGEITWTKESFNNPLNNILLYAGTLSPYSGFMEFVNSFDYSLNLVFVGDDLKGELKGSKKVSSLPKVSNKEAGILMMSAGTLLLTLNNKSIHSTTGKLMEYIKAGRPIVYFGPPNSEAFKVIKKYDIGWMGVRPESFNPDIEGLKKFSINALGKELENAIR